MSVKIYNFIKKCFSFLFLINRIVHKRKIFSQAHHFVSNNIEKVPLFYKIWIRFLQIAAKM